MTAFGIAASAGIVSHRQHFNDVVNRDDFLETGDAVDLSATFVGRIGNTAVAAIAPGPTTSNPPAPPPPVTKPPTRDSPSGPIVASNVPGRSQKDPITPHGT